MLREIQQLQRAGANGLGHAAENVVLLEIGALVKNDKTYDPSSPLSKELQQYPWPAGYKARIPTFDGKTNPRKFIAAYETTVFSARGDATTLVKSLILAVEDIAYDWYTSLKSFSINSWQQVKAELLATFHGYQLVTKTTRDLLNCS